MLREFFAHCMKPENWGLIPVMPVQAVKEFFPDV